MSIKRQPMRAEQPEEMKGKFKDTMKGMFDSKARNSESFHADLVHSLEDNKRKYDRQLYSDWLVKVYARCSNICMKPSAIEDDINSDGKQSLLRESERQCARNCMRKFDRAYKTFDQVEKKIFEDYITEEQIDPNEFMRAL
jgi:hypothetical protein